MSGVYNWTKDFLTTFYAPRHMKVQSKILRITFLVIVISVLAIFFNSFVPEPKKLYQSECPVLGTVNLNLVGQISTEHFMDEDFRDEIIEANQTHLYKRIWDHADLVYPPHGGDGQDGSFIAVTNMVIIANQTRSTCPSEHDCFKEDKEGKRHFECQKGRTDHWFFGAMTGNCINSTNGGTTKEVCEVEGWCPVEPRYKGPLKGTSTSKEVPLLKDVKEFTVVVKNAVEFPGCGGTDLFKTRNILPNMTEEYLETCRFQKGKDELCPRFRLEDVVNAVEGETFSDSLAFNGGVFRIEIHWDCNFDFGNTAKDCLPEYRFDRLDETGGQSSTGYIFIKPIFNEEHRRTLLKIHGIKVLVVTTGHGERFNLSVIILNAGAVVGLFSIAPLFCELLFDLLSFFSSKSRMCRKLVGDFREMKKVRSHTGHRRGTLTPVAVQRRPLSPPDSTPYPWESNDPWQTTSTNQDQAKTNDQPQPSDS